MSTASAWSVTEYRLRNMWKWRNAIVAYGLGGPFLYLASIGLGVGALVDAGGTQIDNVPYLTFLAPALLASAAIQSAQDEAVFPMLQGFLWEKLFFAMHATSLRPRQIANGVFLAALFRTVFTATMYWCVLLLFGAVELASAPALIACATFAGMAFATPVGWVASRVEHEDGFFAVFGRFVVTPMFLFSGTFYPLETLPTAVQWIGWISPLWHATELGRALSYGAGTQAPGFFLHVGVLTTLFVVGLKLTHRQFDRRLLK